MASTIASVIVGAEDAEKRIVLSGSQFGRPHGLGAWTRIRVACRVVMDNTAANITGAFSLGFCHGTTNMPGDASCDNALYLKLGRSSSSYAWSYSAGPPKRYAVAITTASKVGTTETEVNPNTSGSTITAYIGADLTAANRVLLIADFSKTAATTYKLSGVFVSGSTVPDASASTFLAQLAATRPNLTGQTGYGYVGGSNLTVGTHEIDEDANGALDTVYFAWNNATPVIHLCDIGVVRVT